MLHAWISAYISCMEYACFMHGTCMKNMHISCMKLACSMHDKVYSMHGSGIFHTLYRHIPCVIQAYSMCGTGVFHAWYRRTPCTRAPCTVQTHSLHIVIFGREYLCTVLAVFFTSIRSVFLWVSILIKNYSNRYRLSLLLS